MPNSNRPPSDLMIGGWVLDSFRVRHLPPANTPPSQAFKHREKQGRSESNAQPPVLETGALPIELRPYKEPISKQSRSRPAPKIENP